MLVRVRPGARGETEGGYVQAIAGLVVSGQEDVFVPPDHPTHTFVEEVFVVGQHYVDFLCLDDGEVDYEIVHATDCPRFEENQIGGVFERYGINRYYFTCLVGHIVLSDGHYAFDKIPESTGRYEIVAHEDRYVDHQSGSSEYDCWISVGERVG